MAPKVWVERGDPAWPSSFYSFDFRFAWQAGDSRMSESGRADVYGKASPELLLDLDSAALEPVVLLGLMATQRRDSR
jgi:hypothetical protein